MDAKNKQCPKCNWQAVPVHRCADVPKPVLMGWYCPHCNNFDAAVARERKLGVEVKR